jgi:solute carrier family 25 protein 38
MPGVALYFYMLSSIRAELSRLPAFSIPLPSDPNTKRRSALSKLSASGNLVAGAVARTSVGFVLNPITILKARYESSSYTQYHSLAGAFRSLFTSGGVRGLFQGFTATAVRDAPYAGIYVVFYEKCKELAGE